MPKPSYHGGRISGRFRGSAVGHALLVRAIYGEHSAAQVEKMRRAEIRSALLGVGSVIYAVAVGGLIKIGHSTNLENRLQAYGITPINMHRLLMVKPGTVLEELQLHEHFAPHVARGREYYNPHSEIIDYINAVRHQMGVGPIRRPIMTEPVETDVVEETADEVETVEEQQDDAAVDAGDGDDSGE